MNRLGQRTLHGPTVSQTRADAVVRDVHSLCPFRHREGFPSEGQPTIRRQVSRLLLASSPSAVVGAIPEVVIDPLDRSFGFGTTSHIFQETPKISPLETDRDASPTVVGVLGNVRVGASLDHPLPLAVLRDLVAQAMSSRSFPQAFQSQTTTRRCITRSKRVLRDDSGLPTLALADPLSSSSVIPFRAFFDGGQSTETITGREYDRLSAHRVTPYSRVVYGPRPVASRRGLCREDYTTCP
jgi:hypothetical protein